MLSYYAVYWNGRLVVQGNFEYNLSIGMSMRRLKNGEIEDEIGFCVGNVADRNELAVKNRVGNTIFRRCKLPRKMGQSKVEVTQLDETRWGLES